jgi:hypothetical protein
LRSPAQEVVDVTRRCVAGVVAAITALAPMAACGGGDGPSTGAPAPSGSSTTAPPTTHPAGAADAGLDAPTSNGGLARWSARLGGAQADVGYSVAGDSAGNAVLIGSFQGSAGLGGVTMTSAGGLDFFVAKYSPDGEPQWVRRFGGAGNDLATGIAVDGNGFAYVAGASDGAVDFGSGALGGGGAAGTFFVELDPFGNVVLARAFGGQSYGTTVGVAVASDGTVGLCGAYQGSIDLGGGPLPTAQGTYDAFVAAFAPGAKLAFAKHLGGTGADLAQGVAFGPKGQLAVVGSFTATGDFGQGAVTSAGLSDVFASAFDTAGTALWSKHYGGADADDGRGIVIAQTGETFVGGGFGATVDFGAGPETTHGAIDAFVVKLNASGSLAWAKTYGGPGTDESVSVAADSSGEALVGGLFEQTMSVGVTPFVSAGDRDVFALKLGSDGSNVWSKHFGGVEADEGVGVAYDGYGRALVTGFFRTQVDFGSAVQASAGDDDVFVASFDP